MKKRYLERITELVLLFIGIVLFDESHLWGTVYIVTVGIILLLFGVLLKSRKSPSSKKLIAKEVLIAIAVFLLFPLWGLLLLVLLIMLPYLYFKARKEYYRSAYYNDTKEKFRWLGSGEFVKLYSIIKQENLPIEFHRNRGTRRDPVYKTNAYGYFVYKGTLLIPESGFYYYPEYDGWYSVDPYSDEYKLSKVEAERGECSLGRFVKEKIEEANNFFGEDIITAAKVLLLEPQDDENGSELNVEEEKARTEPYVYNCEDNLIEILKQFTAE